MLDFVDSDSPAPRTLSRSIARSGPVRQETVEARLTQRDLSTIHEASMALLAGPGIRIYDKEALTLCRHHGLETDGAIVRFSEQQILDAIDSAPRSFNVRARNPERSLAIGEGGCVFAPAYGAPFVVDGSGAFRAATLADYENLTRIVQALPNQDVAGHLLVQPNDLPAGTAHLHMMRAAMVHSDKPFMGSAVGAQGVEHTMAMAGILFGEEPAALAEQPVTIALVDSLSPLQYSTDMTQTLMAYARWRQPIILAALVMAGATGPITLAGTLAQQNAELLAGVALAQLTAPGTPVVYGSASTIMDMRAGTLAIGSPELALLSAASIELAQAYGLPSRGGGGLTDAHVPDAQAGMESMLGLQAAVRAGADFVLHAAGILSSFLAVSYEKLVLDDDMCGMLRRYQAGIAVDEDQLALDVIRAVGPGGTFLETEHTTERCRTAFWQPALMNRDDHGGWESQGAVDARGRAEQRWRRLLATHDDPPLDKTIVRQLDDYVAQHDAQPPG